MPQDHSEDQQISPSVYSEAALWHLTSLVSRDLCFHYPSGGVIEITKEIMLLGGNFFDRKVIPT